MLNRAVGAEIQGYWRGTQSASSDLVVLVSQKIVRTYEVVGPT